MRRNRIIFSSLIFVILLVGLSIFVYGAACTDAGLTFTAQSSSIPYGQTRYVRLRCSGCSGEGPGDSFGIYDNATISINTDYLNNLTSLIWDTRNTDNTLFDWNLNGTALGNTTVNVTVVDENNNECTLSVNINVTNALNPNITIIIVGLDGSVLLTSRNYTFNVTFNNTGNGTAKNIIGLIDVSPTGLLTLNSSSFSISSVANGSTFNITYLLTPTASSSAANVTITTSVTSMNKDDGTSVTINASTVTNDATNFTIWLSPTISQLPNISILINNNHSSLDLDDYLSAENVSNLTLGNTAVDNLTISINSSHVVLIVPDINWTGARNVTFNATDIYNTTANRNLTVFVYNSSTETCDGTDQDGDTLVDENAGNTGSLTQSCCAYSSCSISGAQTCSSGAWGSCGGSVQSGGGGSSSSSGGGGSSIPKGPTAKITSPSDGEEFKVNELVSFSHSSENYDTLEWSFGDGGKSTEDSPSHAYSSYGSRTAKLTVTGSEGTSTDSVNIKIVECFADNECNGICCNGKCKKPCSSDSDCSKPDPYINEKCNYANTCDAECSYDVCSISCSSDEDCNDNNPETTDKCKNAYTCNAICENNEKEEEEQPNIVDEVVDKLADYGRENPDIIQEDTMQILGKLLEIGKIGLEQKFTIGDGKSIIEYKIKNSNIFTARNVTINVIIPKDVILDAKEIEGDFTILERDPLIQFIIDKLKPGEEAAVSYTIPKEVAEEKLREIQVAILKAEPTREELEELIKKQQETQNVTVIKTEAFIVENTTEIRTSIEPKMELENVTIYLEIPKCLAETLKEIEFERKDYIIIQDDPIIAWVFSDVDKDIKINFKVAKPVSEDCWKQIQALPIAELIKGRIYKEYNFRDIGIIAIIVLLTVGIGIFFAHHEEALKHPKHHGKHILHKDVLKHTFKLIISGVDHLLLVAIVLFNVGDFLGVLNPVSNFIQKLLSITAIVYLVYKARLSEIFFGRRNRLLDISLIIAFLSLVSKSLLGYIRVLNNEVIEQGIESLIIPLYQILLANEQLAGTIILAFGIAALVFLSVLCVNIDVKSPSVLAVLHEKGIPSNYKSSAKKFITTFVLFFAFYIIVFSFVIEWVGIAADSTIATMGLAYFVYRIIRAMIRIFKHHRKHLYLNKVFVGAESFGEVVYEKFISLFHYKETMLLGIGGMLTFHLFMDVINFIIPYILNLHDVIYFGRLGVGHSSLIALLRVILPNISSIIGKISVVGIYLFNTIAMIFLLTIPFYIWFEILTKKKIDFHAPLIALFYASITFFAFASTYKIKTLIGKDILGVDILIINIIQYTDKLEWVYLIAIPIGLLAVLACQKTKYRHILEVIAAVPVVLFFYVYLICFLISWTIYYTSLIVSAFNYHASSAVLTYISYILPLILTLMFFIIVLFYVGGLTALMRYMYMHWLLPRFEQFFAEKELEDFFYEAKNKELARKIALKKGWPEKIVNMAYHHKRLHIHKIIHVAYRILLKLESKEKNDYSLSSLDILVTIIISIFPLCFFLFRLIVFVGVLQIIKVLVVWAAVMVLCLVFTYGFYITTHRAKFLLKKQ